MSSEKKNTWFLALARKVREDAVFDSTGVVVNGSDGRVSGGPGLKETQAYPSEYSLELLRLWTARQGEIDVEICRSVSDTDYQEIDDCDWALLDVACDDLGIPARAWTC